MHVVLQSNKQYVLRFDKGDEVMDGLQKYMAEQRISACIFSGIGSCSEVELGYYNKNLKEYRKKPFYEDLEVVSFNGNGALADGKPAVHAHGMFGRTDFTVFGGHVFRMIVTATCEVAVVVLEGEMKRAKNDEFNLNLLV